MQRLVELGQLFDIYGELLTERQQNLVRQYAFEDCSLAEIAEREGISRQGVRDAIVRAEEELHRMEELLHDLKRSTATVTRLHRLRATLVADAQSLPDAIRQIDELLAIWEENDGV